MDNMVSPLSEVSIFTRGQVVKISNNFYLAEFECKCGKCPYTVINQDHVRLLEELRVLVGKPIRILSAYRCHRHNKGVGGSEYSQHMFGNATDIFVDGVSAEKLWELAVNVGFDGIGRYDTFVHVDSRGVAARWDLRKRRG